MNLLVVQIQITSENTLKDLFNSISCLSNHITINNNQPVIEKSCIIIENVIYYLYTKTTTPLSSEIITNSNLIMGKQYTHQNMESTKLKDVLCRLDTNYLVIHKNNCLHQVVFNEIRMMHIFEDLELENYPKIINNPKVAIKHQCSLCMKTDAE